MSSVPSSTVTSVVIVTILISSHIFADKPLRSFAVNQCLDNNNIMLM